MTETVNPDRQTAQTTPESGLRFDRAWFVREDESGETPEDPDWQLYSDRLIETEADLDPGLERLDQLGSADASDFGRGVEENEVTITYSLQQALVDEDGEPVDAAFDAFARNEANQIPNTHTMVGRDNNPSPGPNDPDGASGQRRYFVMQGGKADVSMEPDAEEADPVPVELTYMAEKVRSYHIYQPAEASTLAVVSTSDEDDDIEVTIEDEGADTSETLTLDGTEAAISEEEFEDIDAFYLSEAAVGDVELRLEDGDGSVLATLDGGESYALDEGTLEGDTGVPPLGEGSAPDPIGESFEDFGGDIFDFDFIGDAPTPDLNNITVEVENNLEARPRQETATPAIEEGNREITIETDVIGERASHDMLRSAYLNRPAEMGWELSRTRFEFPAARCTEPPALSRESEEAYAETDGTWESIGVVLAKN
jgi:hypothetical protein